MFEDKQARSRWRTFWPEVSDLDGAQEAIALGYKACFLLSGLALVLAVLASKVSLVDVVLFGAMGEGVRRKSPAAAVIAAIWMCLNIVASVMTRGRWWASFRSSCSPAWSAAFEERSPIDGRFARRPELGRRRRK